MQSADIVVPPGYEAIDQLHKGPRSILWRARRESDGQTVILKTEAAEDAGGDEKPGARIESERDIAAKVTDDSLLRVLGFEDSEAGSFLVIEDFGGTSLFEQNRGAWDIGDVLSVGESVARALAALHEAGIAHCDVNSRNIIRNPDTGITKLGDYGSASPVQIHRLNYDLSEPKGRTLGQSSGHDDHRKDLFSFGATLFELLCGRSPFPSTAIAHIDSTRPTIDDLVSNDVPATLARLVTVLMQQRPEDPVYSAQYLTRALADYNDQWRSSGKIERAFVYDINEPWQPQDPIELARFALTASTRAHENQEFEQARAHAERGISYLPSNAFEVDYDLAFSLHYALCETACALQEDLEPLDAMCVALHEEAHTRLERTLITALRVWQLGTRGDPERAVEIGLDALEELDIDLRQKSLDILHTAIWTDIQKLLSSRNPEELVERLPRARDPDLRAAGELFAALGYPLWSLNPEQMSVLSLEMARSALSDGTTPSSGLALAAGGLDIARRYGDMETGRQFGRAGVKLAERLGHYIDETRELAELIDQQVPEYEEQPEEDVREASQRVATAATAAPTHTTSSEESTRVVSGSRSPDDVYLRILSICDAIRGDSHPRAAADRAKLPALMEILSARHRQTGRSTFDTRYELARAEVARVSGDLLAAEAHYERAIMLAERDQLDADRGKANELAGCFFCDRGMKTPARAYLEEAWNWYQRAGDTSKVVFMPGQYPGLIRMFALGDGDGRTEVSEQPAGGDAPVAETKKAATKKAATKKAATKKAATKKASTKKASTKKASTKKASTKKAATKKAATKKAATRKSKAKKASTKSKTTKGR